MKTEKIKLILALTASTFLLIACGNQTPPESLTSRTIMEIAKSEEHVGHWEVVDFKRENGWAEQNAQNRYTVRYDYNLQLMQDLPEVVLGRAKNIYEVMQDGSKATGLAGAMGAMVASWGGDMTATLWANGQQNFEGRRDTFVGRCKECIVFWNSEEEPKKAGAKRNAYILAWKGAEELGFNDEAKKGDKIARQAWASFMKTENGWMKAN